MQGKSSGPWWLVLPAAIGLMLTNVVVFLGYMFVYGNSMNPGQPAAFYPEHAKIAGPYASIISGIPLTYLAAKLLGSQFYAVSDSIRAAIWMWVVYLVVDFALVYMSGELMNIIHLFAASFITKLGAAYLGGSSAHRSFS